MGRLARSFQSLLQPSSLLILFAALTGVLVAFEVFDLWPRAAAMLGIRYNTLIVLVGTSLLGASSGLVGSFAVLRRRALMGDALSHAALPGICLAFLWRGERSLPFLLAGALATGLAGVALIAALLRWTRIKEDAAIGIVLSTFFGAGLALSRMIQNQTTTGSKAGLDSYILGKTAGMISQDVTWIAGVSLCSLLIVLLLYKEFKLTSFDAGFANAQGWPSLVLDLAMMSLLAITVVLGLPAVGVVLMAALLILPAAAARFWTDRLGRMLVISAVFGALIGAVGTSLSARFSGLPAGPIIVLAGTTLFLFSVLLAPRRGGLARLAALRQVRQKFRQQKLLHALHERGQRAGNLPEATVHELASTVGWTAQQTHRGFDALIAANLLERLADDSYRLSPQGQARAAKVARAYRLWRCFLQRHPDLAGNLTDLDADALEEQLPPETIRELEADLAATAS